MKKIGFGKKKYVVLTEKEYKDIREELYEAAWRLFSLKTITIDELNSVNPEYRHVIVDRVKMHVNEIDDHVENARDILRS